MAAHVSAHGVNTQVNLNDLAAVQTSGRPPAMPRPIETSIVERQKTDASSPVASFDPARPLMGDQGPEMERADRGRVVDLRI
jgi:hypothetical protein